MLFFPTAKSLADEVSGSWTGTAQSALHYYYEGSTRVIMPEVALTLDAPNGMRVRGSHLVDVITSASIAAGRSADELQDEYRHGSQLSVGKTFNLSETRFSVDLTGRYSTENDYQSLSAGVDFGLYLNADNTILRLGVAHLRDRISSNADPDFSGRMTGWTGTAAIEQVLSPIMVLTLGYQLGQQEGYLGNPYRAITRDGAPLREDPPDHRLRHGFSGRWALYVPPLAGSIHLLCRLYADDWDVRGIAPELRIYKELGEQLLMRFRYRYYDQRGADFYRGIYPRFWSQGTTADPKLAPLTSHTVGLRMDLETSFLEETFLEFAANATLFLTVDRVFTDISYGNQIVGSGGGMLRF